MQFIIDNMAGAKDSDTAVDETSIDEKISEEKVADEKVESAVDKKSDSD